MKDGGERRDFGGQGVSAAGESLPSQADAVTMANKRGWLVGPLQRPRYSLAELQAASDYSQPPSVEEREWLDANAVGRELL